MTIDWKLIGLLFCLCLPGIFIAIPRIINFLLPDNTEAVKSRFSKVAIIQTMVMVFILSITGAILSQKTGLKAPLFELLLQGKLDFNQFSAIIIPAITYSIGGLIAFFVLYYGFVTKVLDNLSLQAMFHLRHALGLSGCMLYGGIVEEVIARWGLMNLAAFFILLFVPPNDMVNWTAICVSALIFVVGQIPAYVAAGCVASRPLFYSIATLSLSQSFVYGLLFWRYGLMCAMLAHMLFHLFWTLIDSLIVRKT